MRIKPIEDLKKKIEWKQSLLDTKQDDVRYFVSTKMSDIEYGIRSGIFPGHEAGFFLNKIEIAIDRRSFYPIGSMENVRHIKEGERAFVSAFTMEYPGTKITFKQFGLVPWEYMIITMTKDMYDRIRRPTYT